MVGDTIDVCFQGTAWYANGKIVDLQGHDVVAEFPGGLTGFVLKAPQTQMLQLAPGKWKLDL